jgi:hypothetical protein
MSNVKEEEKAQPAGSAIYFCDDCAAIYEADLPEKCTECGQAEGFIEAPPRPAWAKEGQTLYLVNGCWLAEEAYLEHAHDAGGYSWHDLGQDIEED